MIAPALPAAPACPLRRMAEQLAARTRERDPLNLDELRDLSLSLAKLSDDATEARGGNLDADAAQLPPGAAWRIGRDGEGADAGVIKAEVLLPHRRGAVRGYGMTAADAWQDMLARMRRSA